MFVGSIQSPIRSVVSEVAKGWGGLPAYVGCSGNFTIENILAAAGVKEIHGNDVSLYTCALGAWLSGGQASVEVASPDHQWLAQYVRTPLDLAATLVLCLDHLGFSLKQGAYYRRMWAAAVDRWPQLHQQTRERLEKVAQSLKLASFWPGDVVEYIRQAPTESAVIAFPPTYKSGYERMYKPLSTVFKWQEPSYQLFDDERMAELVRLMRSKREWVISWDREIPGLESRLIARCQSSLRSHPVNVYASSGRPKLSMARQRLDPLKIERVEDSIEGPIAIAEISQGQMNWLRSQYLGKNIMPASAQWRLAVLVGGKIAGALAFNNPSMLGGWCDSYMMTDLAVGPTKFRRLSKLVIMAATSTEVRDYLETRQAALIRTVGTTAFTDKPVSMKYRGIFELHSRKPGRLNYMAVAGQRSLAEVFELWKTRYMNCSSD